MVKLTHGDKILSIVNSGLSIITLFLTNFFKPEYFNYALIFSIVLISLTIIALFTKIFIQSRRIQNQAEKIEILENNQQIITQDLKNKEERISQLEQLLNVPFFQKWNLLYTFMWRNAISFLNNPVNLFEVHVIRKLEGKGRLKDNNVSYSFLGECVESIKSFRFCLAGMDNIELERIQFKVTDITLNKTLDYSILKNSKDSNIKYVEIFFREQKNQRDIFKIKIEWRWPKTAFSKTDYFSIPNIYSLMTKRIILDLYPTNDMNLSLVDIYKFGFRDEQPKKIEHLYINEEGFYRSIIDNPEKDSDYITYYE